MNDPFNKNISLIEFCLEEEEKYETIKLFYQNTKMFY